MPLSDPAPREMLHLRNIECRGYRRTDGLWDIEAHLSDTKSYVFTNAHRGEIKPGDPLHDMWLRLTLDEDLVIREAEGAIDAGPFGVCGDIAPRFALLKDIAIGRGWTRKVRAVVGGVGGCTHLVELLRPMATVAYQTIWSDPERKPREDAPKRKPGYLDRCHALRSDGDVVRQHFAEWYTGE